MRPFIAALFVFPLLSLIAFGATTGKSGKAKPPPPETFSKVTAVNAKTNEVTIIFKAGTYAVGVKPHVYSLDSISTITVNNVPGKFSDIRAGMIVLGSTERDDHTLDNITLTTTPPSEVPQ
jgi:hypothetical protein